LQQPTIKGLLFVAEPAVTGNGALRIKSIQAGEVKDGMKAEFEHKQRVFDDI